MVKRYFLFSLKVWEIGLWIGEAVEILLISFIYFTYYILHIAWAHLLQVMHKTPGGGDDHVRVPVKNPT
jgi:hypothetical protein